MHKASQGVRVVARVLIQNRTGELLLCRNRTGTAWVPPGGTLDPGETLAMAAAREAEEEAGLKVSLGPLIYVREFRPADRSEHLVEVTFRATALDHHPEGNSAANGRVEPAGPPERPWVAWFIQDVDGPRREVRWFTREALAATPEAVYPELLRDRFWKEAVPVRDPYLGLEEA